MRRRSSMAATLIMEEEEEERRESEGREREEEVFRFLIIKTNLKGIRDISHVQKVSFARFIKHGLF